MNSAETQKTRPGGGLFQVTKDGTTRFLTVYDLKYIKWLQKEIARIAIDALAARRNAMESAEAKANEVFWEKNMEINPYFDADNTLWETYMLSNSELQSIDKYGIYTEEEKKKYNLPPNEVADTITMRQIKEGGNLDGWY